MTTPGGAFMNSAGGRRGAAAAALALGLFFAGASQADERAWSPGPPTGLTEAEASAAAREVTTWVLETADNQGLPFLVVDKINARVFAFGPQGELLGASPALLGLAPGDVSPPGIGERPLADITPEERITPAGRFLASIGENLGGKNILWIDYDSALSLHPVVTTRAADRRLQRLATADTVDNRISYGCINVPVKFYAEIVQPAFDGTMGVVYILPDTRPLAEVFSLASAETGPAPTPADPPADGKRLLHDGG